MRHRGKHLLEGPLRQRQSSLSSKAILKSSVVLRGAVTHEWSFNKPDNLSLNTDFEKLIKVFLFKWSRRQMAFCRWRYHGCTVIILAPNLTARLCLVTGDCALYWWQKLPVTGWKGKAWSCWTFSKILDKDLVYLCFIHEREKGKNQYLPWLKTIYQFLDHNNILILVILLDYGLQILSDFLLQLFFNSPQQALFK